MVERTRQDWAWQSSRYTRPAPRTDTHPLKVARPSDVMRRLLHDPLMVSMVMYPSATKLSTVSWQQERKGAWFEFCW